MCDISDYLQVGNFIFKKSENGQFDFYIQNLSHIFDISNFNVQSNFLKTAFDRKKSEALIEALILKMRPNNSQKTDDLARESAARGLKILQILTSYLNSNLTPRMAALVLNEFNLYFNSIKGQAFLDLCKEKWQELVDDEKKRLEHILSLVKTQWGIKNMVKTPEEEVWFDKVKQLEKKIAYFEKHNCTQAVSALNKLVDKLNYMELPYRQLNKDKQASVKQELKKNSMAAINELYNDNDAMVEIHTFRTGILKYIGALISYLTDLVKNRNLFFVPQTETSKMLSKLEEQQQDKNPPKFGALV